jgi:hypothetical protein
MTESNIEELRKQSAALRDKIDAHERKEQREAAKALLGKCFKYKNCYSCPQTAKDYWWMYARVVKVGDYGHLQMATFQVDSNGDVSAKGEKFTPQSMLDGRGGYQPITLREFRAGVKRVYMRLADVADKAMA